MSKIKLVETFSGIGFQRRGVEIAGFEVDSVATSETDINAIISYAAIHCGLTNEMIDNYDQYPSREDMATELTEKNIGYNWEKNVAYNWQKKINSKSKDLEKVWLACKLSNNFGDICKIESFPQCDLLTYSSPCQNYSLAGNQEGAKIKCKDCGHEYDPLSYDVEDRYQCPHCGSTNITSTRSGLLAEIERILLNMSNNNCLPKFLLQENVDALVNKKFKPHFESWVARLDKLGYNTYWKVLNTKYCATPKYPTAQNRNRVFALSIRKDVDNNKFEFPLPFDCGIRLKNVLLPVDQVPEKFFVKNERADKLIEDLLREGKIDEHGNRM